MWRGRPSKGRARSKLSCRTRSLTWCGVVPATARWRAIRRQRGRGLLARRPAVHPQGGGRRARRRSPPRRASAEVSPDFYSAPQYDLDCRDAKGDLIRCDGDLYAPYGDNYYFDNDYNDYFDNDYDDYYYFFFLSPYNYYGGFDNDYYYDGCEGPVCLID